MEDPSHRENFLKDVALLSQKQKVVLVHGGGKEITRELDWRGIKATFVNGLRLTDDPTMQVVEEVLGKVNQQIVQLFSELGVRAEGYSGKSDHLLRAKPIPQLGRAGKPDVVNIAVFGRILAKRTLPVFYPVAEDAAGGSLNVNADDFAHALALACRAHRLIYLTDSGGVLDKEGKQIARIDKRIAENLIEAGVISGGMIVKARASVDAVEKGVGSVDITKNIKYLISTDAAASAVTSFSAQVD